MRELLTQGTNPNVRGFKGLTAVHAAAGGCAEQNLEVILKHGGDATVRDADGNTPLHHAAGQVGPGCAQSTRLLVRHDAPVNQANQDGNTALHVAAKGDSEDSLAVLLDAGANPRAVNGDGLTPLQLFVKDGTNNGRVVALLLDAGADPDRKTPEGYTPLHVTLKTGGSYGKTEVVEALLAGNADPCIRDPEEYIPYQYNVVHENAPLRDALDRAGGYESACENRAKRSSQKSVAVDRERPANAAKSSGPSQESVAADLKPKCTEEESPFPCWMEIKNKSGCYFFDPYFIVLYEKNFVLSTGITWSGSCSGGLANGEGTLTLPGSYILKGTLVDGKADGIWAGRYDIDGFFSWLIREYSHGKLEH